MKTLLRFTLPLALLTYGSVGAAQGSARGNGEAAFRAADSNGDDVVTAQEALAWAETRFQSADRDGDGFLSVEEQRAVFRASVGTREEQADKRFTQRDLNGDGKLTRDELPKMPRTSFEQRDHDRDGALSRDEFKAGTHRGMGQAQVQPQPARGRWAHADQNRDGKVSRAEALELQKRAFGRLDGNRDGKVTLRELRRAHPRGGPREAAGSASTAAAPRTRSS